MPFSLRTATPDDDRAFERARGLANGGSVAPAEPEPTQAAVREPDRTLVAVDGREIVATSLGYTFRMSIPGEGRTAATAGFAGISVVPTHRRQGALRMIMRHNLDDARGRGEVLSVLWPSESPIYRRFGYGAATTAVSWELDRDHASLVTEVATQERAVRILAPDPLEVAHTVAPVHDELLRRRPGMLVRSPAWWARRTASATGAQVWVVAEGPAGPEAYAAYSVASSWQADGPANTLHVGELAAVTIDAEVALWRYLFGVDLVRRITAWGRPPDDALPHLAANGRRLRRQVGDGAWVRLIDIAGALGARAYRCAVDAVIEVADDFCPWNTGSWHLEADEGGDARCQPTTRTPDISLTVSDLAVAYLGETPIRTLASAGLVHEHTPQSAERLDRAFSWAPAPWGITWF